MEDRKRIYIKDIINDDELLKKLFEHNSKIQESEYQATYEDNMFWQGEDIKQWNLQGVDIRNNYNSFYLIIRDYNEFIEEFDEFTGNATLQELYKKSMDLYNQKNNVDFTLDGCDELYDSIEEQFEKSCNELIKVVEDMLHEYENVSDEQVLETFINNVRDNYCYEDLYYYADDDKYILYEDISYTKSYE